MKISSLFRESFFLFIIVLSLLEILGAASADMAFLKKLISMVLIGVFLFYISPTNFFFKDKDRRIDIWIITALFLLSWKDFLHIVAVSELQYFHFMKYIVLDQPIFSNLMFYFGSYSLILISIFLAFKHDHHKKTLMDIIRQNKPRRRFIDKCIDSIIFYLLLQAFSYFIFALVIEWFALALDSIVVLLAMVYYLTVFLILGKKKSISSFIDSVERSGEVILQKFLMLFHSKKTILFAISGIIIVHSLVDIGNFMLPYIFSFHESFYLSMLDPHTHTPLIELLNHNLSAYTGLIDSLSVVLIYILNVVSMILLLVLPLYIWIDIFRKKQFFPKRITLSLFFASVAALIFAPIFRITSIVSTSLTGADILTQSISSFLPVSYLALCSVIWFVIVYILSDVDLLRKYLNLLCVLTSTLFLGTYIYYFYSSTLSYYLQSITLFLGAGNYLFVAYFLMTLGLITLFYVAGYLIFLSEILHSLHFSFAHLKRIYQKAIILIWAFLLYLSFLALYDSHMLIELIILLITSLVLGAFYLRSEKCESRMVTLNSTLLLIFLIVIIITPSFVSQNLLEPVARCIILLLYLIVFRIYKFLFHFHFSSPRRIVSSSLLGVIFGIWFFLLREPKPDPFSSTIPYIIFFSLIIAFTEELFFRKMALRTLLDLFSKPLAIIFQAIFFAILHLLNFFYLWSYFGPTLFVSFVLSLVFFGIIMALLSIEKDKSINISYAVACHTIANVILLLLV